MSVGLALCIATRTATREEGKICKDVALSTKNIADEYSALSVLSKSCAALIPYGVAAPEIPKRLTDTFILTADKDCSSSVFSKCLRAGLINRETPRATPLSSHKRMSPIHTAYVAIKDTQRVADLLAPSNMAGRKFSGEKISKDRVHIVNTTKNKAFIA